MEFFSLLILTVAILLILLVAMFLVGLLMRREVLSYSILLLSVGFP